MSTNASPTDWISFTEDAVVIGKTRPGDAADAYLLAAQAETVSFEEQLIDEGYAETTARGTEIPWESVFALRDDPNYATSFHLLHLPPETPLTWRLASKGSLTDRDFAITLRGGMESGKPVTLQGRKGAVVQIGGALRLLGRPSWRLAHLVARFHGRPPADRNDTFHRRQWGVIRRTALEAKADLGDFLRRTVVLTPEKLRLEMRKATAGGRTVTEVMPTFEGAPTGWLDALDGATQARERYDIGDGDGIVQVMTTPEIRSVLSQIKRWPGRRVAGARAEAFLRNPFAALGPDATEVLDEDQVAEAKQSAGIVFQRFRPHIVADAAGFPSEIGIDIDDDASTYRPFADDAELQSFVAGLEQRLGEGLQLYGWKGYEFEFDGDATDHLARLKAALAERSKPPILIKRDGVYDLSRYSIRIAGIGDDHPYISTYIVKRQDEDGWFPENPLVLVEMPDRETLAPMSPEEFARWDDAIASAEAAGAERVAVPGTRVEIPVAKARAVAEAIKGSLGAAAPPTPPPADATEPSPKPAKAPTLILRCNIGIIEHPEAPSLDALTGPAELERPRQLKPDVKLRDHQVEGIARMQRLFRHSPEDCRGVLLADDMGLGKTIQLLAFIAWAFERFPDLPPSLVVAPVSLLENWRREIGQFFRPGSLPVLTAYGEGLRPLRIPREQIDDALRGEGLVRFLKPDWRGRARIVLTTYETLRDLEFSFAQERWSIMVCDEAQKIKNPNAIVTRAAQKQNVRFRVACTGTPVENSLADLWCLYDFVQPGFLGALNEFGKTYGRPVEEFHEEGAERLAELREKIAPLLIRRTKTDVAKDLPEKIDVGEVKGCNVAMSVEQRRHYADAFQLASRPGADEGTARKGAHLGILQRLRLICADPRPYGVESFVPEPLADYRRKAPKMDWLLNTLGDIRRAREKALIFAEHRDVQRMLRHYIDSHFGYRCDIVNGDTAVSSKAEMNRQKKIDAFQATDGFAAIILSPLAVGFGVNIQAANHVIHFLRHWNPAKEDQATDRAYRIGATKPVYVYCPLTVADGFKTFDVKLDELLRRKRGLARDTLAGVGPLSPADFDLRELIPPEVPALRDEPITPDRLGSMDWVFFEHFVAALWRAQGYERVITTPGSGDGGIDVVAIRGTEGALIQCKSSSIEGSRMNGDAVRQVVAGAASYRASYPGICFQQICVTNQAFMPEAHRLARENGVTLLERDGLADLLRRYPVRRLDVQR
jgi:Holliday junction resolvase